MRTTLGLLIVTIGLGGCFAHQQPAQPKFAFLFETGNGAKLDTYNGILTKDMVVGPDTTIRFVLPQADLDSVRRRMIDIHFFEMSEPHPDFGPIIGRRAPSTTCRIEATLGDRSRRLFWDNKDIYENRGDYKAVMELESLIWKIIEKQPEYQALPHARGGYY